MAMGNICLPQDFKIVRACTATAMNATVTMDNISAKDAQKVWCVIQFSNATGGIVVVNPLLGAAVATCTTVPTFNCQFWYNAATATTDTLVAQAAGTTFTTGAGATPAMVVVQIDPGEMANQGATLDCIGLTVTGGAQIGDLCSAVWIIHERYAQATPRSAILD